MGEGERLADVVGLEARELLAMRLDDVGQPQQSFGPIAGVLSDLLSS